MTGDCCTWQKNYCKFLKLDPALQYQISPSLQLSQGPRFKNTKVSISIEQGRHFWVIALKTPPTPVLFL